MLDKLMDKYKYRGYDFSNSVYVNSKTPIMVKCAIHGMFAKSYTKMYARDQSCLECSKEINGFKKAAIAVKTAYNKFAGKFTYSILKPGLNGKSVLVDITCPRHGSFVIPLRTHLESKHGCRKCGEEAAAEAKQSNLEEFIAKARVLHNDKYDYSNSKYIQAKEKISIRCPEHGEFTQLASGHLSGYGCAKCAISGKGRVDMNKPCILYYLQIKGTTYYKIGITTQTLNHRYRTAFDREQLTVVFTKQYTTGREAYMQEQQLLKLHSKKLLRQKVLSTGNTEIFKEDIFKGDYNL